MWQKCEQHHACRLAALLLRHTNRASTAAGRLGVLATDAQTKRVAQAAVHADLFQSLQVLTQLVVEIVCQQLQVLAVLDILLAIEEVAGDVVLARVLHDRDDALELLIQQLASPLVHVNVGTAADNSGEAAANAGNGGQGILDLLLAVNVGVEDAKNVLEAGALGNIYGLKKERG